MGRDRNTEVFLSSYITVSGCILPSLAAEYWRKGEGAPLARKAVGNVELNELAGGLPASLPRHSFSIRGFIATLFVRLVLVWLAFAVLGTFGSERKLAQLTAHPLESMLERSGALVQIVEVIGWTEIRSGSRAKASPGVMSWLKETADEMVRSVSRSREWILSSDLSQDRAWVAYAGDHLGGRMSLLAQLITAGRDGGRPFAVVSWEGTGQCLSENTFRQLAKKITAPLRGIGREVHRTLVVRGTLTSDPSDLEAFAREVLSGSAQVIEVREWQNGIELCAYDKQLPYYEWAGQAINVHLRIEKTSGGTWIAIGVPRLRPPIRRSRAAFSALDRAVAVSSGVLFS